MIGTLRELLEEAVGSDPNKVIISTDSVALTWGGLYGKACRVASALVRDGVKPQDRVVYIGKNDPVYFEVLFGCALIGAVPTPLNWRLAPAELAIILEDAQAAAAFVDPSLVVTVPSNLNRFIALGAHDSWPEYAGWLGPAQDPGIRSQSNEIAFQLYTSGTTGRPKGAMFANGTNLKVLLNHISVEWGITSDDVSLIALPLFHMGGLAWALASLARGARCVVVRDFDPPAVLDKMDVEKVTLALFVPTMLSAICALPDIGARKLKLRQLVYSGAPISPSTLTSAISSLHCDFVQIYGLTEATGAFAQLPACDHEPDGPRSHLLLSAGRPYPWVEVRVVSTDGSGDVPQGGVGEIWTRSEQNLVGYWNNPEQTAQALTPDGWLRTGDLGRIDSEGRIFLVDRAKDLVISGGENVYPIEVENVLSTHPDLAAVAVIGVPHARWGETVKAVAVLKPGVHVTEEEIISFARQRLAGFKCPTSVDIVDSLPRTATGKVLKHVLREPYWHGYQRHIN